MSIRLFPCESTVVCGTCPECLQYEDHTGSKCLRYVIAEIDGATYGSVTYTVPGGSPVTSSMQFVGANEKLCFFNAGSRDGPFLYLAGIPVSADINSISLNGESLTSTDICSDPASQILRVPMSSQCACGQVGMKIIAKSATCPAACTEKTGVYSAADVVVMESDNYARVQNPTYPCDKYLPHFNKVFGITPTGSAQITPPSSSRPCNWTDIAISVGVTLQLDLSIPNGCGDSCTATIHISLAKNAGDTFATLSWTTSGSNTSIGMSYPPPRMGGTLDPVTGYAPNIAR